MKRSELVDVAERLRAVANEVEQFRVEPGDGALAMALVLRAQASAVATLG